MAFVRIMTTSTNNITTSASLLSLSATPQVLFAPKEHLPTPVLVKGVTAEVLIFSAETLVISRLCRNFVAAQPEPIARKAGCYTLLYI
jgi:hypothetical protein